MMQNNLAPIGLATYARLQHLQQTVAALQNNALAQKSELYIFSDAPKPGDEQKVGAVREYIRKITGFKKVHLRERESNSRVVNCRGGIEELLENYGKVIFLEEDVVTAPGFLQFMNEALDFYKGNSKIGSISGYCPPFKIPDDYIQDVFTLTRLNPWGVALWNRYYKFNTPISEDAYLKIYGNRRALKQFELDVSQEAAKYIRMDFEGKLDAGDMRSIFWQHYDGKLTVYPRKSLTRSIGNDGSGFHMGATNKWDVSELWNKTAGFEFREEAGVDERIRQANYDFYRTHEFWSKVVVSLQRLGIYKYLRPSIKRIQTLFNLSTSAQ